MTSDTCIALGTVLVSRWQYYHTAKEYRAVRHPKKDVWHWRLVREVTEARHRAVRLTEQDAQRIAAEIGALYLPHVRHNDVVTDVDPFAFTVRDILRRSKEDNRNAE